MVSSWYDVPNMVRYLFGQWAPPPRYRASPFFFTPRQLLKVAWTNALFYASGFSLWGSHPPTSLPPLWDQIRIAPRLLTKKTNHTDDN